MFETKTIRSFLGGAISITSVVSGLVFLPADQTVMATNIRLLDGEIPIENVKKEILVVPNYTGVSQGFHYGHPGIDLTAPLGEEIYPVREGVVTKVQMLRFEYGRAVFIDHGNGMESLYAHMGKIFVSEGDKVNTDTAIGEIGLTGKTTGPHLHMEISVDGKRVNPAPFLGLVKK